MILFSFNIYSQEKTKKNEPILFLDFMIGYGNVLDNYSSILSVGELNYQFKKHLFSFRYLEITKLKVTTFPIIPFIIDITESNKTQEISLLYGRRWIYNWTSISVSAGVSLNYYSTTKYND